MDIYFSDISKYNLTDFGINHKSEEKVHRFLTFLFNLDFAKTLKKRTMDSPLSYGVTPFMHLSWENTYKSMPLGSELGLESSDVIPWDWVEISVDWRINKA